MKMLKDIETDEVSLCVVECDCGFHLGIDATFLDQEGDFIIFCPSCALKIDTAEVFPV